MRLLSRAVVTILFAESLTFGAAIFSVSGPNDVTLGTTFPIGVRLGAVFTTSTDYENVTFSTTWLAFSGSANVDFEAFLTTQIGPGTNSSHELASSVSPAGGIVIANSGFGPYTLTSFEILTVPFLSAGTYYLTLRGTSWSGGNPFSVSSQDNSVVKTLAPGVTVDSRLFDGSGVTYLPEGFFNTSENLNTWFTATGDIPVSGAVPEPGTLALSVVFGVVLLVRRFA